VAETLEFIDGFDDYSVVADATAGGWNTASSIVAGNISGNAIRLSGGQATHSFTADRNCHDLFHWRIGNSASADTVWRCHEGGTEHGRLVYNGSSGTFTLSRAGTTVGTTPTSANLGIVSNTWYHIEVIYDCHDTAGGFDVYVNGVLACTSGAYNVDTRNGGTAGTPDNVQLPFTSGASSDYDDFAHYRGTSPAQKGIARVITKLPTGDGSNTAWSTSSGTRHNDVDEAAPNADTDYISDSSVGDRNTFTYGGLGVTGTVLGVAPTSVARKDDAGARSIRETIRIGATNYDGATDKPLTTTYVVYQEIWATDPSDGAWTVAAVDAAEFGVKLTV
jgi:hypothetical protein